MNELLRGGKDEIVLECNYEPPHEHRFPFDWEFGGANGTDPRTDRRWKPATYEYFDSSLHLVHTTQVPLCDDQAIDEFTKVAGWGRTFMPAFLSVRRSGESKPSMLPWRYDPATDEVVPL